MSVRVSPGSPSQWYATFSPPPEATCRSRQFTDAFRVPPTNHFTNGGVHSSTVSQGRLHSSRPASSAQNASGSSAARS